MITNLLADVGSVVADTILVSALRDLQRAHRVLISHKQLSMLRIALLHNLLKAHLRMITPLDQNSTHKLTCSHL